MGFVVFKGTVIIALHEVLFYPLHPSHSLPISQFPLSLLLLYYTGAKPELSTSHLTTPIYPAILSRSPTEFPLNPATHTLHPLPSPILPIYPQPLRHPTLTPATLDRISAVLSFPYYPI